MAPSPARFAERRERVRASLAGSDTFIVTDLCNIRYLSGFSGSNAVLVIGRDADADVIGTDGRYQDQVAAESPDLPVLLDRDTLPFVLANLGDALGTPAVESSLTLAELGYFQAAAIEPRVVDGVVEKVRRVKDDDELAALARACAITATALAELSAELRPGMTEALVARRLETLFAELGADDRAFETIVGSGPFSAVPHHQPGSRELSLGDLVVIDCGALVDGYHADMTRTFVVGDPQPWQLEIHALVADAQASAAAAYLPGAQARDLDSIAREVIAAGGRADEFTHGLGHGVGLRIHEAPMLGPRATGTIDAGMAITVEPGVYLPGRGGVRIEDTLVVTEAGPRVLTEAPRDLVSVG